jgi:hypothetical protein
MRIVQARAICLHAAADRERAVSGNAAAVPFELFVSSLLDGIVAYLSGPVSPAARRRMRGRCGGDTWARTL